MSQLDQSASQIRLDKASHVTGHEPTHQEIITPQLIFEMLHAIKALQQGVTTLEIEKKGGKSEVSTKLSGNTGIFSGHPQQQNDQKMGLNLEIINGIIKTI